MKIYLNETQACMLQRMCKEEIARQRKWAEEEGIDRSYLSAQMWDLIEQMCANGEDAYFMPGVNYRTDSEENSLGFVKHADKE